MTHITNNPPFGTARRKHAYSPKIRAWMKRNPSTPLPWSYFDVNGMAIYVTDLPFNHPVRTGKDA